MEEGLVQTAVELWEEGTVTHLVTYALNLWLICDDLAEIFQHKAMKVGRSGMLMVALITKQQRLLQYHLHPFPSTPIPLLNSHLQPQLPRQKEVSRVKIIFHQESAKLVKSII
jgi:hypothetical protein